MSRAWCWPRLGAGPLPDAAGGAVRAGSGPGVELRRQIRAHLGKLDPPLQVLAEDLLAEGGRIDFVCEAADGGIVLILVAGESDGESESGEALLTQGLAHIAWVRPRLADWIQLAPGLGIQPDAPVRLQLFAPSFSSQMLGAALLLTEELGPETLQLAEYRSLAGAGRHVLSVRRADGRAAAGTPSGHSSTRALPRTPFRCGLTEADLGLTPAELAEFD